jgi:ribosomal protein S27E
MDVIFDCPHCEQEMEVDAAGAGTEIECPSCGETITIPKPGDPGVRVSGGVDLDAPQEGGPHPINPIASSAAAKVEMHLKVPVRDQPTESLIEKPPPPLEVTAKETDKKIRIKTIRHTDCIEVGHDRFDEVVSQFLGKVGEKDIINISSFNYTHMDLGTQKLMTEFGLLIIYRG